MLMPKRTKYRRVHRGRLKGKAMRGNTVTYGDFGLVAMEGAWITSNQIDILANSKDGLNAIAIGDAVYKSIMEKRIIELDEVMKA